MKTERNYFACLWYSMIVICFVLTAFFTSCSTDDDPLEDENTEINDGSDSRFPGMDLSKCYEVEIDGNKEYINPFLTEKMIESSWHIFYIVSEYKSKNDYFLDAIDFQFSIDLRFVKMNEDITKNNEIYMYASSYFDNNEMQYVSGEVYIREADYNTGEFIFEFKDLVMQDIVNQKQHTFNGKWWSYLDPLKIPDYMK